MKTGFFKDFKEFAMRGNVTDLAIGIVIGGAFGKIVTSLVNDIIMPPIGLAIAGVKFTELKLTLKKAILDANGKIMDPAITLNIGNFIQTVFDFIIIAFCIFLLIKVINRFHREEKKNIPPPAPSKEETLLTEIRDLLKK